MLFSDLVASTLDSIRTQWRNSMVAVGGIAWGLGALLLLMAYGVLGFAVLHAITRGLNARPFLLAVTYLAVLLVSWLMLAICLLGVIDTAIDVRALVARKTGPPTSRV